MTSPADGERDERRTFVVAGAVFLGVLVVLIALVAVVAGGEASDGTSPTTTIACEPGDAACLAAQRSAERPGIIPRPGEGRAPDDPGEPGGWEQVALFGVIVAGLGVIATLVVRSVRRNAAHRTRSPDAPA